MKGLQQTAIDKAAIGFSIVCMLHCLLLPLAITLLPTLAIVSLDDETFHWLLLVLVIPTSLLALTLGCRHHKNKSILALGCGGLLILLGVALWGHDVLGEFGEKALTVVGSLWIATGHVLNHKACTAARCQHEGNHG